MQENKEDNKGKYIAGLLSICIILIGFLVMLIVTKVPEKVCPAENVCEEPQIGEDKAILEIKMYQAGINELDTNEYFFDYWLINYGDTEAKDVKVTCKLFDEKQKMLLEATDSYGNMASASIELGEAITKSPDNIGNILATPLCYVESCENCDILHRRIPELKEAYEG